MRRALTLSTILGLLLAAGPVMAQQAVRPGTSRDTSLGPKDLSGLSIKTPRIRLLHTTDTAIVGGTMWLQRRDPFLAWRWGKDLTQREFTRRDGVFAYGSISDIAGFKGTLSDRFTPAAVVNDQVSCGGCHSNPYRDGGTGTNFAKKSGLGRNATHFFGSGIQEMLAWQIRQKIMQQADKNRDGHISLDEMSTDRLLVGPTPGAEPIDYGSTADANGDGHPDLNNIFRIWYLDADGRVLEDAASLHYPGVAAFDFILEVFGWGEKPTIFQGNVRGRAASLNPTNRVFAWDPFESHGSLEAFDPTSREDPDDDGWAQVSNAGFHQTWIGHKTPDHGTHRNSVGLSTDDPDHDGVITEITEGDLDTVEWYMLNSPRPAVGRQSDETRRGRKLFVDYGCAHCHVLDWKIEAADPTNPDPYARYAGDLRFFDLDVRYNPKTERLEGKLVRLYDVDPKTGDILPRKGSFLVEGIGTDFEHHEMGPAFVDMQYDGGIETKFRTGLLWGNGATGFPWGHDGMSMTLDAVIRRHGGEAAASRQAYEADTEEAREAVVEWLDSLILYSTDLVPTDVDGDGKISDHFRVQGMDTGIERFNPEWLFRVPGKIEGPIRAPDGGSVWSDALVNVVAAYGLDLPAIHDGDGDGFPDVLDECPTKAGYKTGCE